ncbi:MAG: uroporphyrinogen-III synthase, partial [Ferruginibacter sp.]
KTEPIETVEVQQEIEHAATLSTTVVFTSMNAVESVANFATDIPGWKIYCIGNTTEQLVTKYFSSSVIAGTASSAAELAEIICLESEGEEVIFFCGSHRRDELPRILRDNQIDVTEIIVYETVFVPHKIKKDYHGILFFSPSAVSSFFSLNKVGHSCVLFAIGNTTSQEIKSFASNKIIVSDEPGKLHLGEKMIEYFGG